MRASALFFLLAACGTDKAGDSGSSSNDAVEAVCDQPAEVSCVDQIILDLSLHDDKISDADVDTSTDGDDFVTAVDASAGGYQNAANNPWVYVKFTEDGAERVDIDDESALESMDWDMALRRFIIRLNGGSSGPSCVGAASLLESSYDDVTEVPEGISYAQDSYYTGDCTIINDSSGLPGSPQVALGAWWEYPNCVATTGVTHLVQLADGHVLKLTVEQYYGSGQDTCNETNSPGEDSGQISLRWAWMTR